MTNPNSLFVVELQLGSPDENGLPRYRECNWIGPLDGSAVQEMLERERAKPVAYRRNFAIVSAQLVTIPQTHSFRELAARQGGCIDPSFPFADEESAPDMVPIGVGVHVSSDLVEPREIATPTVRHQ